MNNLVWLIILPLLSAVVVFAVANKSRSVQALLVAIFPALALMQVLWHSSAVLAGNTIVNAWQWLPQLGLTLSFRLDGLSLLFCLLILGIGLLVILYARYYLSDQDSMPRFFACLSLFMTAMLGVVLSGNLLQIWFFWELTSISSFLLIGYWWHKSAARKGARMALTITGAGGLALLAGFILIGETLGSYELSVVLDKAAEFQQHPVYPLALCLVLLGAFTKSAQFPFHFWLPNAMAAPTPVSAFLHSATMVKAGIFLLARLYPLLAGTDLWFVCVGLTGLVTLALGAYFALFQHDVKGLLAYSTISHLGLITLLLGLNTQLAAVAAIFHIINHAIFKASLFMAAGIIDHETGTRDMRKLSGLWQFMPITATLAMVASASMAGVPLLNGFLSKEMFFAETLHQDILGALSWLIPVTATVAATFSVAYSARFIHDVFFDGEAKGLTKTPHEPPRYMRVPIEILVALCILVGVMPQWLVGDLLNQASAAVLNQAPPNYSLSIWHGFNLPLLMSFAAMVFGLLIYVNRRKLFQFQAGFVERPILLRFDSWMQALQFHAGTLMRALENGSYQRYCLAALISLLFLTGEPLIHLSELQGQRPLNDLDYVVLGATIVAMIAAFGTMLMHRQRLVALIMISVVGLVVSLLFVRFSAPDLALTQLAVEVVTIVLLMLALYLLPHKSISHSTSGHLVRDFSLAGALGVIVGSLAYGMMTQQADTISDFFLENAKTGGGGTNVVNVILVDFRGFDTLGEIAVLGIAALGIIKLLTGIPRFSPGADASGRRWSTERHPMLLAIVSQGLLPLALMVSVYIFFRGHNLPGGGFIAGLITSVAIILQYVAKGVDWVKPRLPIPYDNFIAAGLLIATSTGLASWFFDRPFLTSWFDYFDIPILGTVEIASAMAFDLGVYLTVVGSSLLILANLGKVTTKHRPTYKEQN